MRNSTIRQKLGICAMCPPSKGKQAVTKGLCGNHYWLNVRLKSAEKFAEQELEEDDMADLVKDADALFSRYIRLRASDKDGMISCFICNSRIAISEAQNMHYIKRSNMLLRFDQRNCRAGCRNCNEYKGGNYIEYSKKLEAEHKGITDILFEEGHLVYKYTREELKNLIAEYTEKIKLLKS